MSQASIRSGPIRKHVPECGKREAFGAAIRGPWAAMNAMQQKVFAEQWSRAAKDDDTETADLQDVEEVALRRSTNEWLRQRQWGPP